MHNAALLFVLAVLPLSAAGAASYTIDPNHSFANFAIDHLGYSTVRGRFGKTAGTLDYDAQNRRAVVNVTIDASSIDTGQRERDEHLRSPDFLNVAEFPEITFRSTDVQWQGDAPASVTGELTILGVGRPVTLRIERMRCGTHPLYRKPICGFDANATIKRSDFGVNYGLPAIGDELQLSIGVEALGDSR